MKVDVTDEVYRKLQRLAKPFEDTPNDVILRLLNGEMLKESMSADGSATRLFDS
jgi:predicted CopG family antitoxin